MRVSNKVRLGLGFLNSGPTSRAQLNKHKLQLVRVRLNKQKLSSARELNESKLDSTHLTL